MLQDHYLNNSGYKVDARSHSVRLLIRCAPRIRSALTSQLHSSEWVSDELRPRQIEKASPSRIIHENRVVNLAETTRITADISIVYEESGSRLFSH